MEDGGWRMEERRKGGGETERRKYPPIRLVHGQLSVTQHRP
jgi:hypothetical protein